MHGLHNKRREICLPSTEHWNTIVEAVVKDSGASSVLGGIRTKPSSSISRRFKRKVKVAVHCECLALHIISSTALLGPAVGYIGVPKLSFLACWLLLQSMRCAGYNFNTRGCRSKAFFLWKCPDLEMRAAGLPTEKTAAILDSFCRTLKESYVRRLHDN